MLFYRQSRYEFLNGTPQKNFQERFGIIDGFLWSGKRNAFGVYGQEAGLDRSLNFFDKDLIDFSNLKYEIYTKPYLI